MNGIPLRGILGVTWMILAAEGMAEPIVALDLDVARWSVVTDGVMGGASTSRIEAAQDMLVFRGELSLANNGGFASVRRPVFAGLGDAERVRLDIRGDGREYQFRVRLDRRFDGVAWRARLPTDGGWQTFELPLSNFSAVFRGRPVPGAGPVIPGQIRQIGFMLADKTAGPFAMAIRSIDFRAAPPGTRP